MKRIVGLDTETHDPYLTEKGTSWVYGEGEVLCTSLYYPATGEKKVIRKWDKEVKKLLLDPEVTIIGANIGYDIGWLEYEMGIQGKTKAALKDVILAESIINEYDMKNLDALSTKYVGRKKSKSALEEWCTANRLPGDFRKHLKKAIEEGHYDKVETYAADDAELPVLVMQQQQLVIDREELGEPFKTDCDLIKIVLKMKVDGIRLDVKQKKKNYEFLNAKFDRLNKVFVQRYRAINFNSPKQIASLMDDNKVPYRIKFKLNGRDGVKYLDSQFKKAINEVSEVMSGFRRQKGEVVCYVEKTQKERVSAILSGAGFMFSANPNVDKKFGEAFADEYPVVKSLFEIKKIDGVLTKFLGENFDKYITKDGRVHCDFNIFKSEEFGTISGRFSASNPNLQQIQSKGESDDIQLAELCRGIFRPEENCWLFKIDYSQVEYRLLVHYAVGTGSNAAREAFINDPDTDYHKFVMDLTGLKRKFAKNCNFGIMYGMGLGGMMSAFGWTKEHAEEINTTYHDALPYVKTTMDKVGEAGKAKGYIRTIGGRRARLRNKDMSYTLLNRLNQGGSADIMKKAMVMAYNAGLFDRLTISITVHDELVGSCPKTKDGLAAVRELQHIMETCYTLRVPLMAEPEIGTDWYHVVPLDMDWNEDVSEQPAWYVPLKKQIQKELDEVA